MNLVGRHEPISCNAHVFGDTPAIFGDIAAIVP
jgi:hypothetical protein